MAITTKRRFYVSKSSWAAQAERKVRRFLEDLPMDHFMVMNDVRFKYGNIDHLVLRNDGAVFMIETKSHRGTVTFDGKRLLENGRPFTRNPVTQMNRNIRWFREWSLRMTGKSIWFTAILVFPEAKLQIARRAKGIECVGRRGELESIIVGPRRRAHPGVLWRNVEDEFDGSCCGEC
jgi:hypothetical protein